MYNNIADLNSGVNVWSGRYNGVINEKTKEYRASKALYKNAVRDGKIIPPTEEEKKAHTVTSKKTAHRGLRYPKSEHGRGRSMDTQQLSQVQKDKIIEIMSSGSGKAFACKEVGVNLNIFARAYKEDKEFRHKVDHAHMLVDEILEGVLFNKAIGDEQSSSDALALRRIRMEVSNKQSAARESRIKIKQKNRELDIKEKAYGAVEESVKSKMHLSVLSREEFDRYQYLINNLSSLTTEEAVEYTRIMAKVTSPPEQLAESNGVKMLNGIQRVDNEFDEDDEED
jgi:hypothetical protein